MQWAADKGAKVVNLSISSDDSPGLDPLEEAVRDLTARYGMLFVVAAGNEAVRVPAGSPSIADDALAVGAVTKADELAPFSSRGPRIGDGGVKPDLTAPGVSLTAARGADSGLPGDRSTTLSGTSM